MVRGGASAVGTAAIQLAVAAGARVIAIAGGAGQGALCRDLGAEVAIDHTTEDVFDAVMDATGDRGADVIFDPIGGEQTETLWTCGALGGRYLAVGFNDDPESGLTGRPLRKLSMANMSVLGRAARLPRRAPRLPAVRHQPVPARDRAARARRRCSSSSPRAPSGRSSAAGSASTTSRPRSRTTPPAVRRAAPSWITPGEHAMNPDELQAAGHRADRARRLRRPAASARGSSATATPSTTRRSSTTSATSRSRRPLVAALVNRLKVVDWAKQHPEVTEERIEAPVVVIGMFRAGTTFLSNLLDADPANRALLGWESQDSVPPPLPGRAQTGPRVDAAQGGVDMLEMLNPAISAIHHEAAADPTECIAVMGQAFQSISWEAIANVPVVRRLVAGRRQPAAPTTTTGWCCRPCRAAASAAAGR